jgi:TRAP-type mannitol/chloroaromatic compound transport system permease large subunit
MVFDLMVIQTFGMMQEEVLAAVPLFIFMGYVVEGADLMARLFRAFRYLLAPLKGALYLGVIFTATIFAMATGIVGAAVTVLGIMAAPIMMKCHYSPRLSAGAIAAGGTLGILIPPSVMLVVMGPVMNVSVAKLRSLQRFSPGGAVHRLPARPLLHQSGAGWRANGGAQPRGGMIEFLIRTVGGVLIAGTWAFSAARRRQRRRPWGLRGGVLALLYGKLTGRMLINAAVGTMQTTSMVVLGSRVQRIRAVFARLGPPTCSGRSWRCRSPFVISCIMA